MTSMPRSAEATTGRLDREVRDVLTPGVVTLPSDASIGHAYGALAAHDVHAVLVVDRKTSVPLGWVTAGGLLHWALHGSHHHNAGQAICEPVHSVPPSATVREAAEMLTRPGVSHVLVSHRGDSAPEGVIADVDVVRLMSRR